MRFSERKGYKEVSKILQINSMNVELRNSLWNYLYKRIFIGDVFAGRIEGLSLSEFTSSEHYTDFVEFSEIICSSFLKIPYSDALIENPSIYFKEYFFNFEWFEVYDFIEFTVDHFKIETINSDINQILEGELAGYRIVSGIITDVTELQEIKMLEVALTDEDFPNVKAHLQRALELLSDRKNPDYRNSIKESISAVESIAKEIAQKPKAELGEALKEIEKKGKLHGAMKNAFLNLYGYTSDANGIRHALMEEPNLTADDAKFFLLTCTSFINYLKAKM